MYRSFLQSFLLCILFIFSCQESLAKNTAPTLNNGHKWRIAYYQGGSIPFYSNIQRELIEELMALGWIDEKPLPKEGLSAEPPYWEWLSKTASSSYLEFSSNNGYSASWNTDTRKSVRAELLKKLKDGKIDLVIAMGTWAGEDLVNNLHTVPTLVFSTTNFLQTGLIESVDDSGYDHVSVSLDPTFFERQVRMYHRLTGFKKLGVAYENTREGRMYSFVDVFEKVSAERGFELNLCEVLDTTDDRTKSRASCMSCFENLADSSDAVFLTALLCADEEIGTVADLFRRNKILSYSVFGSEHAEKGILLSSSAEIAYQQHGKLSAEKIAQVLTGSKPRSLPQVVSFPFYLSINTATADDIGFTIPASIRKIAHEVYDQ